MDRHRSIGEIICQNVNPSAINAAGLYDDIVALMEEIRVEMVKAQVIVECRAERERCAQMLEQAGHQAAALLVRNIKEG